jgi:hypothetical protein
MGNNVEVDRNADDQAATFMKGPMAEMKASQPAPVIPEISKTQS